MSSTLQLNFLEIKMWKLILFVGVICTDIASCQKFRLFNTNYKLCSKHCHFLPDKEGYLTENYNIHKSLSLIN